MTNHRYSIGNKRMTQSIRFYSIDTVNKEKSKDSNQLKSNDSSVEENIDAKKSDENFPKTISEASQEVVREFIDNNIDEVLCLAYSCNVCNTRNSKNISKMAYLKGVVIVRCDKCQSTHLVTDHDKWIDDVDGKKNVEDILAAKGEKAEKIQEVSMQEFFGIKDETPANEKNKVEAEKNESGDLIENDQSKGKSTLLTYFMGKAQAIKQKIRDILPTKQENKWIWDYKKVWMKVVYCA